MADQTLFEKALQEARPGNTDQCTEMDSIRPMIKYKFIKDIKDKIEMIKGINSFISDKDDTNEIVEKMEIWLSGLNQEIPPELQKLL